MRIKNIDSGKIMGFPMLMIILLFLLSCGKSSHMTIGFMGCLSGKSSDLGINGRNGLMIAVHEVNSRGGINGRKIAVSVKDDRFDHNVALKNMREFLEEGVHVVVGPMTSSVAERILDLADEEKILLVSPSATADSLTGKDDFFFRIQPPNEAETVTVAGYIDRMGIKKAAVVLDVSNDLYTEGWLKAFKNNTAGSSLILREFRYDSRNRPSYYSIAEKITSADPQTIILVTDAVDAAMLCQQLKKMDYNGILLSSIWAKTYEFIQDAGASGEGVIFFQHYDEEFLGKRYQQFKVDYMRRYGYAPDYSSISAYESAMVLFRVMEQYGTFQSEKLRELIVDYGSFNLLQGDMHFDAFGDPVFGADYRRTAVTVKDGFYVKVDEQP